MRISIASRSALVLYLVSCIDLVFSFITNDLSRSALRKLSYFGGSHSVLFGVNRKKGNLTKTISSGTDVVTNTKKSNSSKVKSSESGVQVSPSLAQWAATLEPSGSVETASQPLVSEKVNSTTKKGKGDSSTSRRERSQQRREINATKAAQVNSILGKIKELISSTNLNVDDLLRYIQQLINEGSQSSLKALLSKEAGDYSLSWVGSDEAICHIGTGLHKVPLARLQDIFLTIGRDGSGQTKTVQLMEVIRILGPFPNVRNTLQGSVVEMKKGEQGEDVIKICYDSMMDGLGKEITAGKVGNFRYVELNILYADEDAIVCVVPSEKGSKSGPYGQNGANVLLFTKEDELNSRLEKLRAA